MPRSGAQAGDVIRRNGWRGTCGAGPTSAGGSSGQRPPTETGRNDSAHADGGLVKFVVVSSWRPWTAAPEPAPRTDAGPRFSVVNRRWLNAAPLRSRATEFVSLIAVHSDEPTPLVDRIDPDGVSRADAIRWRDAVAAADDRPPCCLRLRRHAQTSASASAGAARPAFRILSAAPMMRRACFSVTCSALVSCNQCWM